MNDYLKIAWRNLWRNSRRTLITAASIFFGVFFAVFMSSLQQGSFENMIDNMVRFYSGYIQIQDSEFKELRSVNSSFSPNEQIEQTINKSNLITQFTQRLETFALAGSETNSYPAMVFGIIPEKEEAISGISKWMGEGEYLNSGSNDILIGKVLAENLNIGVNDSLVLIGQGYHGISAAGYYRVAGLLDFPLPDLSKQVIYMDINNCQEFLGLSDEITSIVLMVEIPDKVKPATAELQGKLDENLTIYSWDELQPELLSLIEGKTASSSIIKTLLFMIIGFGVLATIIMLMHERQRELGVMIAIGFQKTKIMMMIIVESFFIGIIGVLSGIAGSFPLVYYLYKNPVYVTGQMAETYRSMGFEPVLKFSISPGIFITPAIIVFVIFALISFYQVYFVAKLNTVNALRA
ncbi:MAG TPA: FtsX-like permease family protein [Bacteroidales bacterium]